MHRDHWYAVPRFFDFCEGRADRGLSDLFGREDSWWADLLRCHNETGMFGAASAQSPHRAPNN